MHLKDIFIGRCYDYKQIRYTDRLPQVSQSCESLYNSFFNGFSYRPPCALDVNSYKPFLDAAQQLLPTDKAMFWSRVKDLVHEYAADGSRYVTLEDTLIGYMVDGLVWCGQSIDPGINYTRCPSWDDCPSEASEAFWAAASKTFAQSAQGRVTVMLDGSNANQPAYRTNSFFGKHELPNLNRQLVTQVDVLLTHPLDITPAENCSTGSLVSLKQDVTSRSFAFTCEDDPDAILHLLCVDDSSDRACQFASKSLYSGRRNVIEEYDTQRPPVFNAKPAARF